MEWQIALVLMLGMVCGLMLLGVPVAFAFFGANIVGAWLFLGGEMGLIQFARGSMAAVTTFTLSPIPLFLMMGAILFHTGLAMRAIDAVDRLIVRVPGRLSVVGIAAGTVFSSLSGSSIASTAMLGKTLLPEMTKRGYAPGLSMGPLMATGGIAILIPPSALAVLLGSLANISVAQLLIAGIVPGVLMSIAFFGYVILKASFQPHLAPSTPPSVDGKGRWWPFLVYVMPLFGIFIVVVGSILGGIASPSESAALGCVASALAAILYGRFTWAGFMAALKETALVSTMILFIIAGSLTFSQILAFSGATDGMLDALGALELTPMAALIAMLVTLLILGAFLDQVSMLLLTLPFFMPLAALHGIDTLWLGVLFLISMEIGLLTPPFGVLLFTMKGITGEGIKTASIYAAALPFILLEMSVLVLLVALPNLALWLPRLFEP